MFNLMYFGVPGSIAQVRCPESGMSFANNRDNEVTELVSGGRSVYVAPTTFKTFSMSWAASSQKLRHLIDCYNGQYGNGPFYVTDPTAESANVLPARWSNAWQLAHQANGWCKPVVQEWPMAITPSLTDYKTPYRLLLTQAAAGSSVPVEGILRTRTIRVPGKAYWLAAKGVATGGAGIRVRGYDKLAGSWTLITTFTTFTGVLTNVVSTTNTTFDMIELDIYMPLGSTLTLYGMALSTYNYAIPGDVLKNNYHPNPRGASGSTSYWNTAAGTGGTATVTAYDTIYPIRKNYAQNPQGTSATRFASFSLGTGEAGSITYLTGQSDGPIPEITGYGRYTVTTPKTAGSTGWLSGTGAQRNPLKGAAGEQVTVSVWVRYTGPGTLSGTMRASSYTSVGATINSSDAGLTTLSSGVWTRISSTVTPSDNYFTIGWWFYHLSGYIMPAGSTLDCTGVLIEKTATVGNYFDGSFPVNGTTQYAWEGTANNSISLERVPAVGPDGMSGFIRYQQVDNASGGTVGPYMRDTSGYNSGKAGDVRYSYMWVRTNVPRQVRTSQSFKNSSNADVGPTTATPTIPLEPNVWYLFDSGPMVATGDFTRFQQWASTVTSGGVQFSAESAIDVIGWITDKPSDYFDGYTVDGSDNRWYYWVGTAGGSQSVQTNRPPFDFMPVGNGVGAIQFAGNNSGNLVSAVIDRIGLSLDFTEVQNVESRMM
ncbi:tail protein [Arthrobacter phage Amigo]|uniref:Minor tail protein n=5 Tax=Amigovirus amigo TaxID=1982100 RepID=A0A5J6TBR7_9CAUD|nr:tail protein [Arthrobacter phage Amigo]QFG08331.1 minor tail protein [Arthrobacter phage Yeezus]QFG13379.1 minor tail protein [Arthrobacter phage Ichor]QFG13897.1 minor tail protein [Arthrobacter phage Jaek]QJD51684.1 minor tail protein [Arthrobacter phage Boersma]ALY08392.1 minor tail protein [Arthrobacter phage Amigo]